MAKRIAVLTGGGCASGLDPFLEAFCKWLWNNGSYDVLGIKYGWEGLMGEKPDYRRLTYQDVDGLVREAETFLGTSRKNPAKTDKLLRKARKNLQLMNVDGLVAAGGDDTLTVLERFVEAGIRALGVPKTMDWDLSGTEDSVGFWSYCEAIFRVAVPGFIATLKAHRRVGVMELFGRVSGFTVVVGGISGGACYLAIPEEKLDLPKLLHRVRKFYFEHNWALVMMGEAVEIGRRKPIQVQEDDHGHEFLFQRQTGYELARLIEKETGYEARVFQAIHPFRGMPSAHDAVLGYEMGKKAAQMVMEENWNKMLSVRELGREIEIVDLSAFKPRRVLTAGPWLDLVHARNDGRI